MRTRFFTLLALAAALLAAAPAAASGQRLSGVDVSNHQGTIYWRAVPETERFAFLKASEGTDFVDAWYERNRRRAKLYGKTVGAYHFARPDGATKRAARRDGRSEGSFFRAVAAPVSGELLPVLDLEVTGGLRPGLLKQWSIAFVRQVHREVGAKPMIYTSPYFWRTAMKDTQWFAKRGYRALWIAHWGAQAPDVPAGNWAGHGWTFWQYTSCGSVPGMSGCVDKNYYNGADLTRVTIP